MPIHVTGLDETLVTIGVHALVVLLARVRLPVVDHIGHGHGTIVTIGPITLVGLDVGMAHDVLLEMTLLQETLVTAWPLATVALGILVYGPLVIGERPLQTEGPRTAWEVTFEWFLASMGEHV